MCLAQGPPCSDAGEVRTRGPSVSSQAHKQINKQIYTVLQKRVCILFILICGIGIDFEKKQLCIVSFLNQYTFKKNSTQAINIYHRGPVVIYNCPIDIKTCLT